MLRCAQHDREEGRTAGWWCSWGGVGPLNPPHAEDLNGWLGVWVVIMVVYLRGVGRVVTWVRDGWAG